MPQSNKLYKLESISYMVMHEKKERQENSLCKRKWARTLTYETVSKSLLMHFLDGDYVGVLQGSAQIHVKMLSELQCSGALIVMVPSSGDSWDISAKLVD